MTTNNFVVPTKEEIFSKGSFKIYGSQNGVKACEIGITEYLKAKVDDNGKFILAKTNDGQVIYKRHPYTQQVLKDDNGNPQPEYLQESKGWRLKFEFTSDGWKTKEIIFLQDGEIPDLLETLLGKKKNSSPFQRPSKTLKVEHQGEHSFATFFVKGENNQNKSYYSKIDKFSSLRTIALGLETMKREFSRALSIDISSDVIFNSLLELSTSETSNSHIPVNNNKVQVQNNKVQQTSVPTSNVPPQVSQSTQGSDGGVACQDCGMKLDPVKHSKIIEFSTKKYGSPTCFNCQNIRKEK